MIRRDFLSAVEEADIDPSRHGACRDESDRQSAYATYES